MQALMRALDQSGPVPDRTVLFSMLDTILVRTQALEVHRPGFDQTSPATPATCGEAIDVPLFGPYFSTVALVLGLSITV
jgi:hypothetical protein